MRPNAGAYFDGIDLNKFFFDELENKIKRSTR
jgi:hypothetical protein